jgi:DNA-binding NtrC family response regulator
MIQTQIHDQAVSRQPISQKSTRKILVVDDDPHVPTVIRDILVYEGFEVEIAENGRRAVEFLKGGQDIDLIITDMKMPEVDGLELLREIHFWRGHLPVIVLTGYPTVRNGFQAITEGVCEYLAKPFQIKALLNVVKSALRNGS